MDDSLNLKCEEILNMAEKILGNHKELIFVTIVYRGLGWEHGWELLHRHNGFDDYRNDEEDYWYYAQTLDELHDNVSSKLKSLQS